MALGQVQPQQNPVINSLFQGVGTQNLYAPNYIKKGSLMTFGYQRWHHDPYPLLIVTDVTPNVRIRGINLHYLTFPYIRALLKAGTTNPYFSYQSIKLDPYIVNAFRSYKWQAVRQVKMLDSRFILTVMSAVRSFDPTQIQAIRRTVQEQIRRATQVGASAMTQGQTGQVQGNQEGAGVIQ